MLKYLHMNIVDNLTNTKVKNKAKKEKRMIQNVNRWCYSTEFSGWKWKEI